MLELSEKLGFGVIGEICGLEICWFVWEGESWNGWDGRLGLGYGWGLVGVGNDSVE
jgi:hypothetical protein